MFITLGKARRPKAITCKNTNKTGKNALKIRRVNRLVLSMVALSIAVKSPVGPLLEINTINRNIAEKSVVSDLVYRKNKCNGPSLM